MAASSGTTSASRWTPPGPTPPTPELLFGFLGLPGAVLAALLTATVASSGATRRRSEQALLRARGASAAQLLRLAGAEAAVTGLTGAVIGLAGAAVVGQIAFGTASFGTTAATAIGWAAASAVIGLGIAAATILLPARRDLREATVTSGRATVADLGYPAWARYGLDVVLLVAAGLVFTATSSGDYQLVLAPEGVPTIAVSYWALAGPALLWIGAGLLTWRVADLLLGRGRPALRRALHPLTGALAGPVAAGMSRERRPLTRAIVLLALAIAFAASTATFNATYAQQAEADAQLTNGADVTITPAPGTPAPAGQLDAIAALPGVRAVEPVQHRFAYVGTDLQDLYGVRPATITAATALQDTYFSGGTAAALMDTLAGQPDSILVVRGNGQGLPAAARRPAQPSAASTARTKQLTTVPFHYVGVVSEFPTAPKDSFFVANAAYITARTGNDAAGAFLVDTGGQHTTAVAATGPDPARPDAQPSPTSPPPGKPSDPASPPSTSPAHPGRTRPSRSSWPPPPAASSWRLGLAERRRTFAIATALGATRRQLRGMISSEAAVLAVIGLAAGALVGAVLSVMLVKVLTGVFDPPPSTLAVPWGLPRNPRRRHRSRPGRGHRRGHPHRDPARHRRPAGTMTMPGRGHRGGPPAAAGIQPETMRAQRHDLRRPRPARRGGGRELAAQRGDVHVQRLGRAEPVLVPHVGHQRLAG